MYSSEIKLCTQGKNNKKRASDTKGHMLNIERELSLYLKEKLDGHGAQSVFNIVQLVQHLHIPLYINCLLTCQIGHCHSY